MFLKNYPAMKVENCLVITDLHIGITKDIYDRGITIPNQAEKLAVKINKLKALTHTRRLVLLGDIKHKVSGFSVLEKYELERFFSKLKFKDIIIVKGNHDGNIEKMLPKGKISVRKTFGLGEYFFTHGHRKIKTTKKIIVIGHNQPHIKFRDEMRAVYVEPVWVRGRLKGKLKGKKLIIVPAFNDLCGATIVNKDKLLGPIAKQLNKRATHIFLLDGTDLGSLMDLKIKE
ncbi:MAG: metallophosphoesterase [Candidatus Aenigmarchaeota archaeon]|nr:metallophosphoesterase [Candidatus Aenigmarchaeota archaeon]